MLRKSFLLLLLSFTIQSSAIAQEWLWAKSVFGPNKDEILCVKTDPWNNFYVGGRFKDTLRFTPTIYFTSFNGYFDGFIAKYDSSGSLIWARTFGGNADDYTNTLSVDDSGNVYMGGYGRSTTPVTYDSFSYQGTGNDKTFILKINPQGTLVWGKLVTKGISNAYPVAIGVNNGIVSVTGNYGFVNMIIETDTLFLRGSEDIYIATYSAYSGNLLWTKALRSQFNDYAYELSIDDSGNVYTAGIHNATLNIAGVDSLMTPLGYETYICKFSPLGVYQWSKRYRGTGDHLVDAMALSPSGSLYIAGWHGSGSHTLNDSAFSMSYSYNFFLQKISPSGSSQWTRHYHGNSLGRIIGMAVDPFDNVLIAGFLGSQYNFDTISLSGSSSNYTAFIAKVSGNGNLLHAISGGNKVNDSGYNNISVDAAGNAYLVGYYGTATAQTCTFGNTTLTSSGLSDGFIAKYGFPVQSPCSLTASFISTDTVCCIFDSITFANTSVNALSHQWFLNGNAKGTDPFLEVFFYVPGTYEVKLIAQGLNCSDTSTMYVTVYMTTDSHIYDTICQGDTAWFAQSFYTASGTFFHTFPMGPCDSVSYLHLHVNPSYQLSLFDTICSGDTIFLYNGSLAVFQTGIYTESLQTVHGCDSVTMLHLWVDSLLAVFALYGDTAIATAGYPAYQWLDCDAGYLPLAGATSNVFVPTNSGNYTLVVSNQLCIDTAQCQFIMINTIDRIFAEKVLSLFPNPAHDVVNVLISEEMKGAVATIYSSAGQLILRHKMQDRKNAISLEGLLPGVYIIRLSKETEMAVHLRFIVY